MNISEYFPCFITDVYVLCLFELRFPFSHSQELTLADRFMVGVYCFIFASFIVTIVMLRLQRENYYYFADVFYSYTEWMVRDPLLLCLKTLDQLNVCQ